ncbi:glycosyltransferase family 4 protein [Pseudonocardia sp. NPDC049635]|uniref:glycosyltransferase family 4 protein n=1 Tax=Pseudonocardia sp. NPDC049635 TaxID=3155506 RepID=UPI0033CED1C3
MTGDAVYVVTDPGVPAFGSKGCSVHVQEVLRELAGRYRTVHLVTGRPGGPAPAGLGRVVVHPLSCPTGDDLAAREAAQRATDCVAAHRVAALCATGDVELVYQRYALWSAAPMEAATAAGARTVLEINAPLVEEQARHRGLTAPQDALAHTRRALAAAEAPFGVTGPVARWAAALDPHGRDVPVIPNGVDVERFRPPGRTRPDDTGTDRVAEPADCTVAFAGTFRPWHGTGLLVDALALARALGAPLRLLLIGDGPELAATLDRARAAGVPVRATGRVRPDEVPALLHRADAAAAPYPAGEHYFSPLKVAEYLAAGLPTVASAIADLPTLVRDGEEALLVEPGDLIGTATALHRLGTDPALRARLAAAGLRAARDRMSWRATVDATLALLPGGRAA